MAERSGLTAEELDAIVTWNLVRVARLAGQRLADRLAVHGVHPVHFGVLAHLAIESEMTQADLARAVLVRPQSVAALLDGLEARGLIRRTGDRVRGRRNPVRITDEGRRVLDDARTVALAANDLTDVGLAAPDAAELNRLLLAIVRATGGARPAEGDELWTVPPA